MLIVNIAIAAMRESRWLKSIVSPKIRDLNLVILRSTEQLGWHPKNRQDASERPIMTRPMPSVDVRPVTKSAESASCEGKVMTLLERDVMYGCGMRIAVMESGWEVRVEVIILVLQFGWVKDWTKSS